MTTAGTSVAVVGGSLAGLRAAEQLRLCGHTGPVTVYGAEPHLPYNRPPLSKEVLGAPAGASLAELRDRLLFRRRAAVEDVEFALGRTVVSADLAAGTLTTDDGRAAAYDGLVVATGLRPRRLSVPGPLLGRHVLRTVDDCHALRAELRPGARVVVVGAGFVGCEVAATLRTLGHEVTVVEPAGAPMVRVLGDRLAEAVQRHHEAAGIRFLVGESVAAFTGTGSVTGVLLGSGAQLDADVVVESVGSVPNTEWLEGNGLDLSDGVLTDNDLGVTGASRAVAVGDVARFPNPLFDGVARRVEHWSIPTDTATRAAATLAAQLDGGFPDPTRFTPVPSFWSDQLDLRFQSYGSPGLADEVRVEEGALDDLAPGLLATHHRAGVHVGTVAVNLPPARLRGLRGAFTALVPTA